MIEYRSHYTSERSLVGLICCLLILLSGCSERVPEGETPLKVARQIDALFLDLARKELSRQPEIATQMGINEQALGFAVHSSVNDRSQAGFERARLDRIEIVEMLENAPLPPAGSKRRLHLETVLSAYRSSAELAEFGHGRIGPGIVRPYAMDQLTGGYLDLPELLMRRQNVRTVADAEAWLLRLSQLNDTIEDEMRRLKADADAGIVPPQFILERMANVARNFSNGSVDIHPMKIAAEDIVSGISDTNFEGQQKLAARAENLIRDEVLPAYIALAGDLDELAMSAPEQGGMWRVNGGADWYRTALIYYSSDPQVSAESVHKQGLDLVWEITAQLDIALTEQGLVEGSVGERLTALSAMEDQVFTNDEEGRVQLLDYMRVELELSLIHI